MDFRKNLLDLYYQKYVQYKVTTIIVMFTYFIGMLIAFLTKQLDITSSLDLIFAGIISVGVFGVCINFLIEFNYHLKKIPEEIKKL